jgi:hypothetical protein
MREIHENARIADEPPLPRFYLGKPICSREMTYCVSSFRQNFFKIPPRKRTTETRPRDRIDRRSSTTACGFPAMGKISITDSG